MDYTNHATPYIACVTSSFTGPTSLIGVVVVKAQYKVQDETGLMLALDSPEFSGDRLFSESQSLEYSSDFVPYKPNSDLIVNATVPSSSLVTLQSGSIDKSVTVHPERFRDPVAKASASNQAELRVPLRYEFCASDPIQNPIGMLPDNARQPFVQHSTVKAREAGATNATAAMCAMPIEFGERSRHLGTFDETWAAQRWPAMPSDFSSSYFNAAPIDQQLDGHFVGDEAVNFRIQRQGYETTNREFRLPGERPRVFIKAALDNQQDSQSAEVMVVLDTVWIDVDAGEVSVVWRGNFPAQTQALKELVRLDVFVEPTTAMRSEADYLDAIVLAATQSVDADLASAATELDVAKLGPAQISPLEDALRDNPAATKQMILNQIWLPASVAVEEEAPADRNKTVVAMFKEAGQENSELLSQQLDALSALENEEAQVLSFLEKRAELLPASRHENSRAYFMQLLSSAAPIEEKRFHDVDFSELDLTQVSLINCVFERVDFSRCKLAGASLVDCRMSEVDLGGADLTQLACKNLSIDASQLVASNWSDAKLVSLQISNSNVSQASFRAGDIESGEFTSCSLAGACFDTATLSKAIFRQVDAKGTSFFQADLSNSEISSCDFCRSKLVGATFQGMSVEHSTFEQVQLNSSSGMDSCWIATQLNETQFNRADFSGALLTDCELYDVNMDRMNGVSCQFDRSNLSQSNLTNANFMRASFDGANLRGTKIEGSNLYEAGFLLAQVDKDTSFNGSLIQNTVLEKNVGVIQV